MSDVNDPNELKRSTRGVTDHGVVFVEPNPFASRLHVLGPILAGSVGPNTSVSVVMPRRPDGNDLDDFMDGLPRSIRVEALAIRHPVMPRAAISFSLLIRHLWMCVSILRPNKTKTIVLTAVDDYVAWLPLLSVFIRVLAPKARIIVIRYRVADLMKPLSGRTAIAKFLLFRFCRRVLKAQVAIFDERVPRDGHTHLLPDPWIGNFGSISRTQARETLGWRTEEQVILLVGKQDERKGFDVAVEALLTLDARLEGDFRVLLVGGVSESLHTCRHRLIEKLGSRFEEIRDYVTDDQLSLYFSASSVVLLPYHQAFTSTSGVLVRAAASGTPVVVSQHGLVGWRTVAYSLGRTFSYPDSDGLVEAISETLSSQFDASSAVQFARASTASKLTQSFREILNA